MSSKACCKLWLNDFIALLVAWLCFANYFPFYFFSLEMRNWLHFLDINLETKISCFLVISLLRRRVVQVFERGARILDGSFMTQDLSFGGSNSETGRSESSTVMHVSIVDPYVLVRMADGSIQILVGGMLCHGLAFNIFVLVLWYSFVSSQLSFQASFHESFHNGW